MCGLFGFIALDKPVSLNLKNIVTLGTFNDYRGGDSVGILVDNNVEYGVDNKKLFTNFYKTSKLLVANKKVKYVLGHTRKASVGKVSLETAQPVCIYSDEGELEFVLLHNGTISNYKDLAKKYLEGSSADSTDSMIMAYILYFHGYEVMKEYIGAGMFITCDYRKDKDHPTISFYKGASKDTPYTVPIEEERPLFLLKNKEGIWFSSLKTPLEIINLGKDGVISNLNTNVLAEYVDGKFITARVIDRSHMFQNTSPYYQNTYNQGAVHRQIPGNPVSNPPATTNNAVGITPMNKLEAINILTDYVPKFGFEVKFLNNKYTYQDKLMHGVYYIAPNGLVSSTMDRQTYAKAVFYNGTLVLGESVFTALCTIQEILTQSVEEFENEYTHLIYRYAYSLHYSCNKLFKLDSNNKLQTFSGVYCPLFVMHDYSFGARNGSIIYRFKTSNLTTQGLLLYYKSLCEKMDKVSYKEYESEFLENLS